MESTEKLNGAGAEGGYGQRGRMKHDAGTFGRNGWDGTSGVDETRVEKEESSKGQ